MNKMIYVGIVLLSVVVIFIVQNMVAVDIRFLFWKISMSRSLMIFFVLAIGIAIGWISAGHYYKRRN